MVVKLYWCKECKVPLPPPSGDLVFDPPAESDDFDCRNCLDKKIEEILK